MTIKQEQVELDAVAVATRAQQEKKAYKLDCTTFAEQTSYASKTQVRVSISNDSEWICEVFSDSDAKAWNPKSAIDSVTVIEQGSNTRDSGKYSTRHRTYWIFVDNKMYGYSTKVRAFLALKNGVISTLNHKTEASRPAYIVSL